MLGGGQTGGAGGPGWGPENSPSGDQALPGDPTWAPTAARPARARCPLRAGGGASCAGRSSCACAGYRSSRAPGVGWALCSDPEVEAYEVILESRLLEQRLSAR